MSGLVAVFRRDGDVSRDQFESLLGQLDYCGHDGRDYWIGDGIALGHQHYWTTPESVGENQPLELDACRLAFVGRVDNRDELESVLPTGASSSEVTDAELFGRAYETWGPSCLERLVGSFAVALWDRRRSRLLLARDKTGLRGLFAATTEDVLVAASDAATVRSHPEIDGTPEETAVGAFLLNEPAHDDASFHQGVRRLPPGSRLVADAETRLDRQRAEQYWHPSDGPNLAGSSRAELCNRFRRTLQKAVEARLRTRTDPAVMMSGGVDSTTVAGLAAADLDTRLPAFSMVFERVDDPELVDDERERLRDTADEHDLPLTEVLVDDAWPLSRPSAHDTLVRESPVLDPLQEPTDRLHEQLSGAGHEVVLTGEGGNMFDGSRFAYADLLRRGRILKLARAARRDPMPTGWLLKWYGLAPTMPSITARLTNGADGSPTWLGPRLRDLDVPAHTAASEFWSLHRRRAYRAQAGLRQDLAFHTTRQRALRDGLELRTPLLDARVVELAYAIPPHKLFTAGKSKALFHSTFDDVLPESVRAIPAGQHFGTFVNDGFRKEHEHLTEWFSETHLERQGYLTDGAPADLLGSFLETGEQWALIWRLYGCERWLDATITPGSH